MTVHLIPSLIEYGHSPTFAATVAGLFGLMSLAGRLLIGPLGDRYPRRWITAGLMGMQLAGLGVLAITPTMIGALIYVALFGAGSGTQTIMRAALLAERYGPEHYGSINGTLSLALTGARTLAPIGAGVLAGLLGGYTSLLWMLMVLVAAGLVALLQAADT
jgi:MFS family permease